MSNNPPEAYSCMGYREVTELGFSPFGVIMSRSGRVLLGVGLARGRGVLPGSFLGG